MDYEKLRARLGGVSSFGTLCGVFALTVFISGCPTAPPPGGGGGGGVACDADNPCDAVACSTVTCVEHATTGRMECIVIADCDTDHCIDDACVTCIGDDECDDEDECTDDTCVEGECAFTATEVAAACDDADACTGAETCDPTTGECTDGDDLDCDDSVDCTDDSCDATDGCVNADNCDADETCNTTTGDCDAEEPPAETSLEGTDPDTGEDLAVDEDGDPVNFASLVPGDVISLIAPTPPTAMTRTVPADCTCAWDATPDTAGTFDPEDECVTDFTVGDDGGGFTITVVVTCDGEATTFDQDATSTVPTGPQVAITGCPTDNVNSDTDLDLGTTLTEFTATGVPSYAWAADPATGSFDDATDATVVYTTAGSTTITVTVQDRELTTQATDPVPTDPAVECTDDTVGDDCEPGEVCIELVCNVPGTEDVFVNVGDPVSGECDITVEFTPELTVEAGSLAAVRSSAGTYFSGNLATGTAATGSATVTPNSTSGTANQQGVDADAIAVLWSVDSQPDGSGVITFSNGTQGGTTYLVGAPLNAGEYVFRLTATNEATSESSFDTVILNAVRTPGLRLLGTGTARRNVLSGNAITLNCEYRASVDTTYNIYSKAANATGAANQSLLATVSVNASPNLGTDWATVDFPVDTSEMAAGAITLLPGWEAVDSVGVTNANAGALAKGTADEVIVNNRGASIAIGAARTETQVAAVTTGTVAAPAEPVGLDIDDQVGAPADIGTGQTVDVFNTSNVIYPGIGVRDGDVAALVHEAGSMIFGTDLNGDGLDDILYTAGGAVDVLFGSVSMPTVGGVVNGVTIGAAGDPADVDVAVHQDWIANDGAFSVGVDARYASGDNVIDLAVGDFNNDGQNDLAMVLDGTDAVRVLFLDDALASNVDPFTNAVAKSWTPTVATGCAGGTTGSGDFNGDGRTDACFGLPAADPSNGANTEGMVVCIYGELDTTTTLGSGVPAAGVIATVFESTADGYHSAGTAAANNLWGQALLVADITGSTSADLVFIKGLATANEVVVLIGSVGDPADPADDTGNVELGDSTANDFAGGNLTSGNLTGSSKDDLVVGLPGLDTGTSASAVDEGAVYVIPSTGLVTNANISAASGTIAISNLRAGGDDDDLGFGSGVAVLDFGGDGTNDLICGHDTSGANGNTFYVLNGPLTSGTGINFNNTQNGFSSRMEFTDANGAGPFEGFFLADVNGDAIDDFVMVGADWAAFMAGLE